MFSWLRNQSKSAKSIAQSASLAKVESLEPRVVLNADVPVAALMGSGFEQIHWNGETAYAKPGSWIVQLDQVRGRADEQLARVRTMLQDILPDAAMRHLGADGLFVIEAPGLKQVQLQNRIQGLPGFRFMEPDFAVWINNQVTPNDPSYTSGNLWGMNKIDAPSAWGMTVGAPEVVVAVIDTGVNYNHPDLQANMWVNPYAGTLKGGKYVNDIHGWNFHGNNSNPMDPHGHGTHVAGTIAAVGNNGTGVTGVSWNSKIMALQFLGADGSGSTSAAIEAINYATMMRKDYGVNVVLSNNSWGGGGSSTSLRSAIVSHGNAGIMFVAAAGNDGRDIDSSPNYPASYNLANMITVAATNSSDGKPSWSNWGKNAVHLGAPGESILSTRGTGYSYSSGTSMAAPHVSGVVALAWSLNPKATVAEVKNAILSGVDNVSSMSNTSTGGRLNAFKALSALPGAAPVAPATPVAASGLAATAVSTSQVNLVWADNATNETGFRIERATDSAFTANRVSFNVGANVTSFSNTGLAAGTTYHYRVFAVNGAGDSTASNTATATTQAVVATAPAAPANLAANAASSSQINLAWEDRSGDETGFIIQRSANGVDNWAQVGSVGANVTTFAHTGLTASSTHYYRVLAYNSVGSSSSNVASATTLAVVPPPVVTAPAAPTNVVANPQGGKHVRVSWTYTQQDPTGFEIRRVDNKAVVATVSGSSRMSQINHGLGRDYEVAAYVLDGNTRIYSAWVSTASASATASTTFAGASLFNEPALELELAEELLTR